MRKKYYKGVLESKCYFREKYIRNIKTITELKIRGSLSLLFFKLAVLQNFTKSTEKHLHWSLFFNKYF